MRRLFAIAMLLGAAAEAPAQQGRPKTPEEIPPRHGVSYRGRTYFQATPKQALDSAIETIEKGEMSYFVAHLMEPAFVDARVAERARRLEPVVEAQLATLRDFQQKNIDKIEFEARVPTKPDLFHARVLSDTRAAAFRLLVRDIEAQFAEDPTVLKELRRFRSGGTFDDKGEAAKVGLPDFRDRELFFKKLDGRWYLENRQTEETAPEPKTPEPKKE